MVVGATQLRLQEMERFQRDTLLRLQQAEHQRQCAEQEAQQSRIRLEAHLEAHQRSVSAGLAEEAL